jgi:DNA-binding NarL/FixJ family response regulator
MSIRVLVTEKQPEIWASAHLSLQDESSFVLLKSPDAFDQIVSLSNSLGHAVFLTGLEFLAALSPNEAHKLVLLDTLFVLLIVDADTDDTTIEAYIRVGCSGVLTLADNPATWCKAVRCVSAGELWLSRRVTARAMRDLLRSEQKSLTPKLTPREAEILNLLGSGFTNRAIADQLFITKDTVRWHLRTLYSKLGVSDRVSAITFSRLSKAGLASSRQNKAQSAKTA